MAAVPLPLLRRLTGSPGGDQSTIQSATDLEAAYAHPAGTLRGNFVVSLDGAVELDGHAGPLGGPADQELLATLRALADVVLVGAGTVRAEGYGPAWLAEERRGRRGERGQSPLPLVAVVTRSADLDPGSRLFTERRTGQPEPPLPLVLTCAAAPAERVQRLADVAEVVVIGDDEVPLVDALAGLRARNLDRVLCEGGPGLLGGLLAARLMDELCLTHSLLLAGGGHLTLGSGSGRGHPATRWRLTQLLEGDGQLFARYAAEGEV